MIRIATPVNLSASEGPDAGVVSRSRYFATAQDDNSFLPATFFASSVFICVHLWQNLFAFLRVLCVSALNPVL